MTDQFFFYNFVFYTFVFYNSKFICLLFIQFTFYTFVFYTVRFLYCSLFKRSFFIIQNLSFLKIKTYTGIDTFFNNSPTLFDPRVPFTAVGVTIFGRMPGIELELLRPQPGVLPMSYTHSLIIYLSVTFNIKKNCTHVFILHYCTCSPLPVPNHPIISLTQLILYTLLFHYLTYAVHYLKHAAQYLTQ